MDTPISDGVATPASSPDSRLDLIRWLFGFNDWTRPQTMRAIAKATEDQLRQPGVIAGGQGDGSIFGAFLHIVAAENHWLARWMGSIGWAPDGWNDDVASLGREWDRLNDVRKEWLAGLNVADLDAPFLEIVGEGGAVAGTPLWPTLVHLVMHTSHHRSEIYEALTRFGVAQIEEPDVIDHAGELLGMKLPTSLRFLSPAAG